MMKEESIRIQNLSTGYLGKKGTKVITRDVNAVLYSGELTCLLGANGAGKSTLLRTLSAFLKPLDGDIWIKGKQLTDYKDKELATVIGVVLTEKCHLRNMSVFELIGMGRSPYTGFWGTLTKNDQRIVDDAIVLVGIEELRERMVHTLSDGERQKVMIAKALAQETPVIFLDEPTAFLDYPSKVEILHLLHRLSREMNKTIFLSTHDLELALQIADQVWLMDREKGITIGAPEDLALDGSLDTFFFQRKGIAFDRMTGLYRIDNEYHTEIFLEGDSEKVAMLGKALRRNGIRASHEAHSEYAISIDETTGDYVFQVKGKQACRTSTIKELMDKVNQIKNENSTYHRSRNRSRLGC